MGTKKTSSKPADRRAQDFERLGETDRGTEMGDLLRQFWQPVALSRNIAPGSAKALRILSEDLTLYRGESGKVFLVGGRCAHRCARLHTGWVEGDEVRCIYHGWKYDGTGQCVETPAERPELAARVRIPGYPVREYCGIVFAYLGEGAAPEFDLPRKDVFEEAGRLQFARQQNWPCHWFQLVENQMDALHISFVHQKGKVGIFGKAITTAIPELEYIETSAGVRQIATRGPDNVRVSDWTFPNNNHVLVPGITKSHPWMDISVWQVPVDEENTARFTVYSMPSSGAEEDRKTTEHFNRHVDYNPPDHHDELFHEGKYPEEMSMELVSAQDYVAAIGQGAVLDRTQERLASSDAGVAVLRKIFWRELAAVKTGRQKHWVRQHDKVELQSAETLQLVDP